MSTRFRMVPATDEPRNRRDSDALTRISLLDNIPDSTTDVDYSNSKTAKGAKGSSNSSRWKMRLPLRVCFSVRGRKRLLRCCIICLLVGLLLIYGIVPVGLYLFPGILKSLIFLNYVNTPLMVNHSDPSSIGLLATHNFYIQTDTNVNVGTWHVLPKSLANTADTNPTFFELSLRSGHPIVVYMHGNSGSRASGPRVELYQMLRDVDSHVVAFDYRGYGDSSPVDVSEEALVQDGKSVFRWVKQRSGNSPVFIWGHSLGAGVATHAVSELCQEGNPPMGLILEAPFNNMGEEVVAHPFSSIFRQVPWYGWAAKAALKSKNMMFDSDKHISGVTVHVVILHAEDDRVIPLELGKKLYQAAVDGRPKTVPTSLIIFDGKLDYGHRYICEDPDLPKYIRHLMDHPRLKLDDTLLQEIKTKISP